MPNQADYYGDESSPATGPATNASAQGADEGAEPKTALIDSALCPGMTVGDEITLKIEKVMDKEYLVSYAPEAADEQEEAGSTEGAEDSGPPPPGGGMAAMME
jgi:hypothetical protein